jgi:hypothetical protein
MKRELTTAFILDRAKAMLYLTAISVVAYVLMVVITSLR